MSLNTNSAQELVRTFASKGTNQGANHSKVVRTIDKSRNNNNIEKNTTWLTIKEGANLISITERAIQKNCKAGKYTTKLIEGNGGLQYRILLTSLPPEAQAKYWEKTLPNPVRKPDENLIDFEMQIVANAPEWQRVQAQKYLALLNATAGMKGAELKRFVKEWNASQTSKKMHTSYARVMQARKDYKEYGVQGLLAGYGKSAGTTTVKQAWYDYFKMTYLVEGGPTIQSAWMETYGYARQTEPGLTLGDFPSYAAFMRRLKSEKSADAVYLARNGYQSWNRKFGTFISRDLSNISAGDVWFSDHRQLDSAVFPDAIPPAARREMRKYLKANKHNKPIYPWLTLWRDMKTGKWLGWDLHVEAPNTDHILNALYKSIHQYGIPKMLYIDNGKDYRAKHFTGKRYIHRLDASEHRVKSLVQGLNIEVTFSLPYNPQSKSIERDFKIFKDWYDRRLPGYRGGNHVERPEKLADEIASGAILDFEAYYELHDYFILNVLNKFASMGKVLRGRSRDEAWNEEFSGLPKISADALKLFCMRTGNGRRIGRNGYYDSQLEHFYWAEWMDGMKGKTVYMRRDPAKYQEAWVFSESSHEFLGKAFLTMRTPGIVTNDIERRQLEEAIRRKNRSRKMAKEMARDDSGLEISVYEQIENLARAVGSDIVDPVKSEAAAQVQNYRVTAMDNVMERHNEMERQGSYLNGYTPARPPQKKKIVLFESDLEGDDE